MTDISPKVLKKGVSLTGISQTELVIPGTISAVLPVLEDPPKRTMDSDKDVGVQASW